jgi:hypothetical protein
VFKDFGNHSPSGLLTFLSQKIFLFVCFCLRKPVRGMVAFLDNFLYFLRQVIAIDFLFLSWNPGSLKLNSVTNWCVGLHDFDYICAIKFQNLIVVLLLLFKKSLNNLIFEN